jgi:hypothetical protein
MTAIAMRTMLAGGIVGVSLALAAVTAVAMGSLVEGEETDNCSNEDGAFDETAFVLTTGPAPGERVESGFDVTGCSRTFESNVRWKLLARDGSVLASGYTTGGGVDGPGTFSFTIPYTVNVQQLGDLEVFAEDASDGEGFPPGRTVIPLILKP